MNILFYSPEFNDWMTCINKLKIPNIKIFQTTTNDLNQLVKTLRDNNIDILIPTRYNQMKFIINNIKPIKSKVKILCPDDYDIIDLLDNKIKFRDFMIQNELENMIPITYQINKTIFQHIIYPCIFKLAITYAGGGSHICDTSKKVTSYASFYHPKEYFLQEFIYEQTEHGAHLVIDNGKIKWAICYKTIHPSKLYIQKGRMTEYEKINNFDFTPFEKIFMALHYSGFACIDFKIVDGNIKIFEINPRLGGTLVNNKNDFADMIKFICNN